MVKDGNLILDNGAAERVDSICAPNHEEEFGGRGSSIFNALGFDTAQSIAFCALVDDTAHDRVSKIRQI